MNDCSEIPFHLSQVIERNFEFLLQYVKNIDKDVLYSLLLSEMDNPKGLETIMCDMLRIPNATDLIHQFQSSIHNMKRDMDQNVELAMAVDSSKKYFKQISEMFPDVDKIFLEKECQMLENEHDCSRFINTVMLSGAYSKNDLESSRNSSGKNEGNSIDNTRSFERRDIIYSSDEESTSSFVVQYEGRKRGKRRVGFRNLNPNGFHLNLDLPSTSKDCMYYEEIDDRPGPSGLSRFYNMNNITQANGNNDESDTDMDEPIYCVHQAQNSSVTGGETFNQEEATNFDFFSADNEGASNITNGKQSIFHSSSVRNDSLGKNREKSYPAGWAVKDNDSGSPSNATNDEIILIDDDSMDIPTASDNSSNLNNTVQDQDMEPQTEEELSIWVKEHTAELMRLFPQTDPSYLRDECVKFKGSSVALNEFVISKLEENNMPSRAEYEKRKEMEELQYRYTTSFSIEDFLKVMPDPWSYFKNKNRNCSAYRVHSLAYLKSVFKRVYFRVISVILKRNNDNLYLTYLELKKKACVENLTQKCPLKYNGAVPATINIQFLQEVAFIKNEKKIKKYIEAREAERKKKFEEAKRAGTLLECQCCYNSEVMAEDMVYCPNDHGFCKSCVTKYAEVGMGQAKHEFPCLVDCGENYTLTTLQNALKPELFSKVIQAIQLEEVRAAGIEDLVQCPFCNYATIMPPEEKIMTCLNPECQRESCRLCKELNHIPLRCDENEKSEEVKMRTYIENKMTEALVRTCYKCGKGFVKVDGCNKTVCSCGAIMCYVCRKPVEHYSHFNGQGGTDYTKCPLFSTNNELHVDTVRRVAEEAKAEVLRANPDKTLKHDPTTVLPERTDEEPIPGINERPDFPVAEAVFRENEERVARIQRMQGYLEEQRVVLRRRIDVLMNQRRMLFHYRQNF